MTVQSRKSFEPVTEGCEEGASGTPEKQKNA